MYRSLRQSLVAGTASPGDQIVVTEVAKGLRVSPTPVREALARLVGEGLVEDRRRHGYFVPLLSWFDLLELYDLCEALILAALRDARDRGAPPAIDAAPMSDHARTPQSFGVQLTTLLSLSRNARLLAAGRLQVDCLSGAIRIDARLYGDSSDRIQLSEMVAAGNWRAALQYVRREFRRRRSRAESVAFAMAAAHRAKNRANIV
ncbi:GntR family transcriptional regulator [Sphingomonas sp. HF-S4]|uniref:GntR family transcriptional regulator n=1 Tax=Sphingomonas agrestis TaxID=3080540 RepID=A0ABU3Y379_9SPHN|nr:GntR family transcriptional regulator [Sphingomonas sp. HF-S4]MDV3455851.1 GntR family transcriptional regulator [Sphingomonas sp. HF-S4]